jgi:hypothetical protein
MDVDLPGEAVEVVFEAATRLILSIEIEERERDLVGDKPFREVNHEAGLAYPTFAALSEHDSLLRCGGIV